MTQYKKVILWISSVIVISAAIIILCISITEKTESPEISLQAEDTPFIEDNSVEQTDDRSASETEYITFGDSLIEADPLVPKSKYDTSRFYISKDGRMKFDGIETFDGIDVSEHREEINWEAVKNDGIYFAMIRIGWRGSTEGNIYKDERFDINITTAQKSGIKAGVYFFSQATSEDEAKEEAENVIEWLKPYSPEFPVAYDWELPGNDDARTLQVNGEDVSNYASIFCKMIMDAGYIPAVYMNKDLAYNKYNLSKIKDFDFWAAEYEENPVFYYSYNLLQYSSKGNVDGINGNVDMNLAFKDYSKND